MVKKFGIHERLRWVILDVLDVNNLTYKQFSETIGWDVSNVINFVNLKTIPDDDFLYKLAEVYGVSPEWVFSGVGKPYLVSGVNND